MTSKSILITGAAGFIGSHLVDRLIAEGTWQITVIDDLNDFYSPELKRTNIATHLSSDEYRFVEADIRDVSALETVFNESEFDCIVHLAARAGVRPSLSQPRLYYETNVTGTLNLLEMARVHGVRQFVNASSSSVYGINSKMPFSEEDCIQ